MAPSASGSQYLTGAQLDRIVRITQGEVCLYPNCTELPPPGQGLNVTAECTLHGVFPKRHPSGTPLDSRRLERFVQKLQDVAHTEFVGYEGETGKWTFLVRAGEWKGNM